jgi:hypothetical protein
VYILTSMLADVSQNFESQCLPPGHSLCHKLIDPLTAASYFLHHESFICHGQQPWNLTARIMLMK